MGVIPLYAHVQDDSTIRFESVCATIWGQSCDCIANGFPVCMLSQKHQDGADNPLFLKENKISHGHPAIAFDDDCSWCLQQAADAKVQKGENQ